MLLIISTVLCCFALGLRLGMHASLWCLILLACTGLSVPMAMLDAMGPMLHSIEGHIEKRAHLLDCTRPLSLLTAFLSPITFPFRSVLPFILHVFLVLRFVRCYSPFPSTLPIFRFLCKVALCLPHIALINENDSLALMVTSLSSSLSSLDPNYDFTDTGTPQLSSYYSSLG